MLPAASCDCAPLHSEQLLTLLFFSALHTPPPHLFRTSVIVILAVAAAAVLRVTSVTRVIVSLTRHLYLFYQNTTAGW